MLNKNKITSTLKANELDNEAAADAVFFLIKL